jgi:hypothetical protein
MRGLLLCGQWLVALLPELEPEGEECQKLSWSVQKMTDCQKPSLLLPSRLLVVLDRVRVTQILIQ